MPEPMPLITDEMARGQTAVMTDVVMRWLLSVAKNQPCVFDQAAWSLLGAVALVVREENGDAAMRAMLQAVIESLSR